MRISSAKLFGLECLYLLLMLIAACIACPIQFIGKKDTGATSGFLFANPVYQYNMIAYAAGLMLFLAFIILTYRIWVSRYLPELPETPTGLKVFMILISLVFAFLMFVGIFIETLFILGLSGNPKPEACLYVTAFGWPVATFVYIGTLIVLHWKPRKAVKEDTE